MFCYFRDLKNLLHVVMETNFLSSKLKSSVSLLLLLFAGAMMNGQKIVGFAPYYRSFPVVFDFSKYTHIHFFAIWPDSTGDFIWPGTHDSLSLYQIYSQVEEKAHRAENKVLITFGGTSGNGSKYFPQLASDSAARLRFSEKAIDLCRAWNADGIDIDWEWSRKLNAGENDLSTGYEALMSQLHILTNHESLLLSTNVSASSWFGDNYPVNGVDQADYINVMSYTYNGGWASTANHHSPLSKTVSVGFSYWTGRGILPSKLNMGVPFYAFEYSGATKPGDVYSGIKTLTYTGTTDRIASGFTVVEDLENGPYCFSDSSIVFYDSPTSLAHKVQHVKESGYSGLVIWELGQDDPSQTLSKAIFEGMNGSTETALLENLPVNTFNIRYLKYNQIVISSQTGVAFDACLYSLEGRKLVEYRNGYQNLVIPIGDLPGGAYLLVIQNGILDYKKIIIKGL